ncbi:MAG: TIGR03089 family protein [Mycobacteriales bacterium]
MTGLTAWTGGLAGERDPAQPLLTLHDGPARVELSGATTANWVAKSANLLVDGLGGPQRVGLLLPLHWQSVALLLAGVATGATVVLARDAAGLAGCDAAFTTEEQAAGALDAGVDDVLALSGHPLGAPCGPLPAMVTDYAREVPSYGDGWGGPRPADVRIEVAGAVLSDLPPYPVTTADRVLFATSLGEPVGLAALLAVLRAGAALVLLPDPTSVDLARVAADERATATWGVTQPDLPALG